MKKAIELLTIMYTKEHINGKEEYVTMKKEDLIKFCIKLLKEIEKY